MERVSECEQAVMEVLWKDAPLTASDLVDRLAPTRRWSVSTVKTMLTRLVAKGAVAHETDGRRFLYRPTMTRGTFLAAESGRLIDRLFQGRAATLVAHLAEQDRLSDQDIDEIEALLKALRS
jgi:predicted transcriptional regulator